MPTRPAALAALVLLAVPSMLAAQKPKRAAEKAAAPAPVTQAPVTPLQLKALAARAIGPAIMGGRVSDLSLDPSDPATFYVALGTGGVMKTTDNGNTFSAIFEKEAVVAVGAVAVAPSNPKVIYVGTGEANDRNSSQWGNGVYRSDDGGGTWTHLGLPASKTIPRILVHPTDPNTVWVAVMGDLWTPGGERGVYRTTDGGATWTRTLAAPKPHDAIAGAGDMALDPSDPTVLYAALYARRRTPWSFESGASLTPGADVGGIYKSTDGGVTWAKLTNGLPPRTQRIGLSVSRSQPRTVYAVIQSDAGGTSNIDDVTSKAGGIFRTDDAGATWRRVNPLNPRPFYFSKIRVDPTNPETVYVLGFALHTSIDGGRTFTEDRSRNVHSDLHALVIDPANPKRLILGTDGGVYMSYSAGESWIFQNRFAGGQFYRVNVDLSSPYRVCGGLQDNLTWVGPSRTNTKEGIRNSDWLNVYGGDGFYCVFDPEDPDLIYAEAQQGYVHRLNMRTGELKDLRPEPTEGQAGFRFHWNSPLIASAHQPRTFYLAGNRVFRLTERGDRWTVISPDLSTNDAAKTATTGSGAENYGVVYTLAESPKQAGLLWAGTDDGKVWRTTDDGATWTDLTPTLPVAIKGLWMNRIEASPSDPQVAYLAASGYRTGNYGVHAYRTADGGKTWQSIAANLPANEPIKVIREDLLHPSVLYAGTEFGLYVSLDRGGSWVKFGGLPTVAVDDIVLHPREHDLLIGTHGRSLYIVDDARPLAQLTDSVRQAAAHLFAPRPADGLYPLEGWSGSGGSAEFKGENPPEGALLTYWVKEYTGDPVKLAIKDATGRVVATLTGPGTPGLNRLSWDLKPTKDRLSEYGGQRVRLVKPGTYTVTLSFGAVTSVQPLEVRVAKGVETW